MPVRVLLTAFEPFDGTGLNASEAACRRFLEQSEPAFDLRFAVLPVEYGRDTEAVEQALSAGPVGILLHTGQATGSATVRVERLAVNRRYTDPRRRTKLLHPIEPDGPPSLESTLPVEELAAAIRAAGVAAEVSEDAGDYLCNHVLYRSLQRAGEAGTRVGFLHLPRLPEQAAPGEPSMPVEETARAVEAALAYLIRGAS